MKKYTAVLILLMFLLYQSVHVVAAPYWVKPGVYVRYAAVRYEPYLEYEKSIGTYLDPIYTMMLFYEYNGVTYQIHAKNTSFVEFKVLADNGTHLRMASRVITYNVTCTAMIKKGLDLPVFWDSSWVIRFSRGHSGVEGFEDYDYYKVILRNLTISGRYWIRKSDGMVIGDDGKVYGHTFLWYDPTENLSNDTPYLNLSPIFPPQYFEGISGKDEQMKTHYGTFGPPLGYVDLYSKHPTPIKVCIVNDTEKEYCPFVAPNPFRGGGFVYDPSTGITIAGDFWLFPADLRPMGVIFAHFSDQKGLYDNTVKKSYQYFPVLQLYDTNAEFRGAETVPFSKPKTPAEYVFYGSLILVGLVIVLNAGGMRNRGKCSS
ncbi:hypothetical protein [Thermococcus zilligii]|uniref:hypothetical protein n=1 Tax=Thermococcus zilligii TaxID=54076 RepID=UPI000299CF49|nr:hypothetical protein [Thermococcus zilligii]